MTLANFLLMHFGLRLKVALASLIVLLAGLMSTQAQVRGLEAEVQTGTPPGLIKKVVPEYPPGYVLHGAKGRGRFRLTINQKTGLVDEVKILQSTGFSDLNELAAKALLQWQFQPGTRSPVEIAVEFYIHGGGRILH
jgi:TonB family protein